MQALASLAQPAIVRELLGVLGAGRDAAWWLLWLAVALTAGAAGAGVQQFLISRLAENVVRETRIAIARSLFRMPFAALQSFARGDVLSRATNDAQMLRQALIQGTVQLLGGAVIAVGALIAMALVDPVLLLVTAASVTAALSLVALSARRLTVLAAENQAGAGAYASSLERALGALPTILSFNAATAQLRLVEAAADETWASGLRFARLAAWMTPLTSVAVQGSLLLVLGLGGYRVSHGHLSVADLIAFAMYLVMLLGPVSQAAGALAALGQAASADARIREIDESADAHGGRPQVVTRTAAVELAPRDSSIEFASVSFSYPHADVNAPQQALSDVSFRVNPGERVAIVGPSGSGKSTILSLLERFYEPVGGRIEIGSVDIATMGADRVRSYLALVQQDAPVLAGSVYDNLRLGRDADEDECRRALRAVNLGHLARGIGGGDATALVDRGDNLSGGERQRLAVARALLADRPVLLLDEATSHIDGANEQTMQAALASYARGKTQLIVAHRLAGVMDCDRILVMNGGRVEDIGTHHELVDRNEFYATAARQQRLV